MRSANNYIKVLLWDKPRRIIIVKQKIKDGPQAAGKQLRLFAEEEIYRNYRYSTYVTNLKFAAAKIWRLYRERGDAANRIKECKRSVKTIARSTGFIKIYLLHLRLKNNRLISYCQPSELAPFAVSFKYIAKNFPSGKYDFRIFL